MASPMLVKKEAELDRRELNMRTAARLARVKEEADKLVAGTKRRLENVKESGKMAVGLNGVGRVSGTFLEAYIKRKTEPDTAKKVGPVSLVAAIAGYTIGIYSDKPADSLAAFAIAGLADGMASRFLVQTADKTFENA